MAKKLFSAENQPKTRGRKKGRSPSDWLRILSHTKIHFHNPLTDLDEIGEVSLVVAIQLILKATQDSDLPSIKEYFDRLDGKVPQKLLGEGLNNETKIFVVRPEKKEANAEGIQVDTPAGRSIRVAD